MPVAVEDLTTGQRALLRQIGVIPATRPQGEPISITVAGKQGRPATTKNIGVLTWQGIWYKEIHDKDVLHTPPAIAYDRAKLSQCHKRIKGFQVWHKESGTLYYCLAETFVKYQVKIDRGFGPQNYLCLEYWEKVTQADVQSGFDMGV